MSEPRIDPKALEIVSQYCVDHGQDLCPCADQARAIMAYASEREAKLRAERDAAIDALREIEQQIRSIQVAFPEQKEPQ